MIKIDKKVLRLSHEFFVKKVTGSVKYYTTNLKTTETQGQKFLDLLTKRIPIESVGAYFLRNFLAFQYKYFTEVVKPKTQIPFTHIFGVASLERYFSRDRSYDWQLLELHHHFPEKRIGLKKPPPTYYARDLNKVVFSKHKEPLSQCLPLTTLYNHKDVSCIFCKAQSDCKKLLLSNYPNIARERGYVK